MSRPLAVHAATPFLNLPFYLSDLNGLVDWSDPLASTGIRSWFDHDSPDYKNNNSILLFNGTIVKNEEPYGASCADSPTDTVACGYYLPSKSRWIYYDGHDGVDFLHANKPVLAAAAGKVIEATTDPTNSCFGKVVKIQHASGYVTLYGHLDSVEESIKQESTKPDDQKRTIEAGEKIGISGNTSGGVCGTSTGAHLHFGLYLNGQPVDPFGFMGTDWLWIGGQSVVITPGTTTTIQKTIKTPKIPMTPDIVLLADTTTSMGPYLDSVKAKARYVVDQVKAVQPDAQFAVAEYKDFTPPGCSSTISPYAFQLNQAVTASADLVQTAVNSWSPVGGSCDIPEDNLNALFELATGPTGFRAESSRIIAWFGDAPSDDPSNSHTLTEVIDKLVAANIRVVAVNANNLDGCGNSSCGQATAITAATKGKLLRLSSTSGAVSSQNLDAAGELTVAATDDVAEAILEGLQSLSVTVTPQVSSCSSYITVTFDALSKTVTSGEAVTFTVTIAAAANIPPNTTLSCQVDFLLDGKLVTDPAIATPLQITVPASPEAKPDLRPYQPPGYFAPVVPSSVQGTQVLGQLLAGQPTYFDWHFVNSGNAIAVGGFVVELWVDNTRYVRYPQPDFAPSQPGGSDDWREVIPEPGWHTVRLIVDPDNVVTESDETNNVWENQFYWQPDKPLSPTLQSPYSGAQLPADQPVVLSWSATGAEYQLEYWNNETTVPTTLSWQSATSSSLRSLLPDRIYWWHVKARNSAGESDWSEPRTFKVVSNPLDRTWYFAEGYTGPGFDEYLTIQNPNARAGTATITYLLEGAAPVTRTVPLPPTSRTTVQVHVPQSADNPGGYGRTTPGQGIAAKVESDVGVIVERPIYFTYGSGISGGHNVLGVTAPRPTWLFAEGYTGAGFDEYLTIMNPHATDAPITLTYYLDGASPVTRTFTVPATRRHTVQVHVPQSASNPGGYGRTQPGQGIAARVETSLAAGIVVERPMYFRYGAAGIGGGHNVMGAAAARTVWSFADGNTTPGYDEYLTLLNPSAQAAQVSLTYYTGGGATTARSLTVPANARTTVVVHGSGDGVGRGLRPAVTVTSTNGVGLVVERPLYTPTGGDNVMGAADPRPAWLFAEGYTGTGFQEELVILNPNGSDAPVTLTYYLAGGSTVERSLTVAAQSRRAVDVNGTAEGVGPGQAVSAQVSTTHVGGIIAERAMAFTYNGTVTGYHTVMGYAP